MEDETPTRQSHLRRLRNPLAGRTLGPRIWLVPVVLLVGAGVLAFVNDRNADNAHGASDARKVVTTHVEELLSYDFRELESDLARESKWLTGSFAEEYRSLVTDKIAPAATKAQVVTDAKVSASGVIDARHHKVELLLFVNVTTRSSELADARTAGSRLVVKASWVDGSWRISSLKPV
ncbi:hypothetical protein [Nocardioides sp. WS12]|uniref:hypothetical protein n=1 Tax=Nocardioides sp. WS12 TaxID=2486272 RepID=UPI0015FB254C|nr:hypothetical protein [Nocardioides sp. WS12]